METLIKQELYKIFIIPIIIFIIMIGIAILSKNYSNVIESKLLLEQSYSGFSWSIFLMIIQASTIITMEFHHGTIKNLLYRNYTRTSIILSKLIALFIYSLIVFVLCILTSLLLNLTFFSDIDILKHSGEQLSPLKSLLLTSLATYVGMWLILSLTLLLSCILKGLSFSIAVGIVFYFATSILAGILFMTIEQWEWLK